MKKKLKLFGFPALTGRSKSFLIMKQLFILMLAFNLNVFSEINAQQINEFRVQNATLKSCIKKVEQLSGLGFLYNGRDLEQVTGITLELRNVDVSVVLEKVLDGTGYTYKMMDGVIAVMKETAGKSMTAVPKRTLKGTVTDKNGVTLPGVSVLIRGTQAGVATDINGNFELRLDDDPDIVLQFSFMGMKPVEVKIGQNTNLKVILEPDTQSLDEVVVTGYQTISKERATGSFDRVDSKVIDARPTSDLTSALQGVVAGMQATERLDGSVSFQIRGTSSLYADKQPLVVVDGFPIQGNFNSINPNDVESVTVLKDAAAASIWGARSANGVIVITTKKGKKEKLSVDIRAFYRMGRMTDLDYTLNQADSRTHVDYELKALENKWFMGTEYAPAFSNLQKPLTLVQELYYKNKYFGLPADEMNAEIEKLRNTDNREQLKEQFMRRQSIQQYNISISGGTERSSNYFSLMYEKNNEGTIKRGYNKFMANYNNQYHITKWLKTSISTTIQRKNTDSSGPAISDFTKLSPYEMLLNPDGSYAENICDYNRYELSQVPMDKMPYNDWSYNLLREIRGREISSTTDLIRLQLGLNVNLLRGLAYDFKVQYETSTTKEEAYYNEDTYFVRNMVNFMTAYDNRTKTVGISRIPKGGINSNPGGGELYNYVIRNQMTFDRDFGKHGVSALAGLEISEYNIKSVASPWVYGYDKDRNTTAVPAYGFGSSVDPFTNFIGSVGATIPGGSTSFSERTDRYVSYYFNAGYTFDNRYGVSFSARGDGSNFVSDDPKLRWAPMWSVGANWNASKETFLEDVAWLNRLGLRFTYGLNGNVEKSTSPLPLISMAQNTSTTTGTLISSVSNLGNPELRWETTATTNVGVDFAVLNNKLYGKLEFYNRVGKDVVGNVALPALTGTTVQKYNNAGMLNRGFELELTGDLKAADKRFGWRSTLTYAYNKNKITSLYYPSIYASQLAAGTFVEGRPVGSLYSFSYAGTKEGVPHIYGPDGVTSPMNDISLNSRALGLTFMNYEGTGIPPHTLGWSNNFKYKDFSLYVFITGNFGGFFKRPTNNVMPSVGGAKTSVGRFMSEVFESDGSLYPTFPNSGDKQYYLWERYLPHLSYFVESSSFIRLKEIMLEYNLSSEWIRKIKMQDARLFLQVRDLGLIYTANKKHYDPEWLPGRNKPVTTFTFGINVKF